MIAFLTTRVLGLARGIWLLIILAALALAYFTATSWFENAIDTAADRGAATQREGDLRETLNRTEEAHAARDEVRDPNGSAAYGQCLRTARTPANCQRFLPRR